MSVSAAHSLSAMRSALLECLRPEPVLVACSGGPDSLALAAVAAEHLPASGISVSAAVVDHGLQEASTKVADAAADACRRLGISVVTIHRVEVRGSGGMEAAARRARRAALLAEAKERGSRQILLAHTKDDQAETVLLQLARGSGTRSLSAMRPCQDPWHRPWLALSRDTVHRGAADTLARAGIEPWDDPHNHDDAFARVRIRRTLSLIENDLGPGITDGLARTAALLRDDADALDTWAQGEFDRVAHHGDGHVWVEVSDLVELPRAVRTRLIRHMHEAIVDQLALDTDDKTLTFDHVQHVEACVSRWRGQGEVRLPGPVEARVRYGRLTFTGHPDTASEE